MYRILVADDEMIERKVLVRRLQKKYPDCEIVDAENGREVLEKYHKIPAEILILDIEMPGITGLEAAETLREEGSRSAIIFLTAYDSFSYAKKAVSVHALDYLLKPCDEKELLDVVDAAMHYVDGVREGTVLPLPIVKKDSTQDTKETSPSEKNQATDNPEENPIRAARMKEYIDRYYMKDIAVQDIAGALGLLLQALQTIFRQKFRHLPRRIPRRQSKTPLRRRILQHKRSRPGCRLSGFKLLRKGLPQSDGREPERLQTANHDR